MIKNIFIPEKIGSYYIFPKRVIGFDIGKKVIHACKVALHGNSITIDKCIEERIAIGDTNSYTQRMGASIRTVLDSMGSYDEIHTAIDSSRVIFKKLSFPFIGHERIKKVLPFEIAPLLPFPLHEAVVDFIIIDENSEKKTTEVLVAAVKNEQLEEHIALFKEAGVEQSLVTVDLFALYGLYKRIPAYENLQGDVALIDLGVNTTRIAYIHNGKLSFVRVVTQGVSSVAKMVANDLGIELRDAMDQVMRFGIHSEGDEKYSSAVKKSLTVFWNDLLFTLRSFSMTTDVSTITKLLILGAGSDIKGVNSFVTELLNIPCATFDLKYLLTNDTISSNMNNKISSSNIISLSVAFPSEITEHFNFMKEQEQRKYAGILRKQILSVLSLIVLIFSLLLVHSFFQLRRLNNELQASEREAVKMLKSKFPDLAGEGNRLGNLIDLALEEVGKEEERIELMRPDRISYLNYLLELVSRIDKKGLGFVVESIRFDDGIMTLKARVRDFDALRKLEDALRKSKLFNYTESQEETEFEAKINLVQNMGEV